MKKVFSIFALFATLGTASAQDISVTNNSLCDVQFYLHAINPGGSACTPTHSVSPATSLSARSSATYTPSSFPGWPAPGTYAWHSADSWDATAQTCPQGYSGPNPLQNTVGTTYCSTYLQTGSFAIITICNTPSCPAGTMVNTTWSDNGPLGVGTPTLDFN
jgi:hypothetical protein